MVTKVKKYPKTDFVLCSVLSVLIVNQLTFPLGFTRNGF